VRLVVPILLLAVLVFAAGSAARTGTVVHHYGAFKDGKLAPGLRVRATRHGRCGSSSTIDRLPNSWRCFSGRLLFDPCFSPARADSRIVACPERPWSRRVVLLRLGRPTGVWQHYKRRTDFPWGIRTTNGKSCFSLAASARGSVAGRRITYQCEGGGLLAGYVHRNTALWTIRFARHEGVRSTKQVGITDVWN